MKVCLVAAPLEGRRGVFLSARNLVTEARSRGWEWSAVLGMRPSAPPPVDGGCPGVLELTASRHGFDGVAEIVEQLQSRPEFLEADAVITLITQSDLALARLAPDLDVPWVAYVRGLPWPARGEQGLVKRVVQRVAETRALRAADDVWATTDVLADSIRSARAARIVPAGVPLADATVAAAPADGGHVVWAGRFAVDKRPELFAQLMADLPYPAVMFGAGALEPQVRAAAPGSVEVRGWSDPSSLWDGAAVFVGTSYREAFGRSAVEAASVGVPVVVGDQYGAAPLLYTDPGLRSRCVVSSDSPAAWAEAVRALYSDPTLWAEAAAHVQANARELSIARSVDRIHARLEELTA